MNNWTIGEEPGWIRVIDDICGNDDPPEDWHPRVASHYFNPEQKGKP